MPVLLNTPIVKHTVVHQAVKEIILRFPHKIEESTGELRIDPIGFEMRCDYGSYGDTGAKLEKIASTSYPWSGIPPAGQDMIKALYQWLETQGEINGVIAPGVKNDPEPTEPV
jgi:hypothetical protein